MSNTFYTASGNPGTGAAGLSALMRTEFLAIQAAFDEMPRISTQGNYDSIFVQVGDFTFNLPASAGTLALTADVAVEAAIRAAADATEATARAAADTAETARATAAESANATAITDETTRATAAEDTLTTEIGAEATTRAAAIAALAALIMTGTGPPMATLPRGRLYLREDGGVGTTLYVSQGGGFWNSVVGV